MPKNNIVFIGDWSNLDRGQLDHDYDVGEYDREAGFRKLKEFLWEIGQLTRSYMYAPIHDIYGHFEFLRDQGFTIVLCPMVSATAQDLTDPKLIKDALDLLENYDMEYLCVGSGDGELVESIAKIAKTRGVKLVIVYGSERSLSGRIKSMVDEYPPNHAKQGQKMMHLFSPSNKSPRQQING